MIGDEEQDWRTRARTRLSESAGNSSRTLNENRYQKDINHAILRHLNSTYVIEKPFSFPSIINDMKRFLKKVFKSKKPSLRTIRELWPATSTSTTTGLTDLMQSTPACDSESTSAQVAAGVRVSVHLFLFSTLRIFMYWLIVIEQTAHNLGISTPVSASEISDLLPVSIPAAGANLIS